ncbi:DUF6792 domain-containing protein [Marininema halotolerans]|nr:DUF6792 domain-containing protein [Marininema halotolerans]
MHKNQWWQRGATTLEYVIIIVLAVSVAMVLVNYSSGGGQTLIKEKIMAIINGDLSGNDTHQPNSPKKSTNTADQQYAKIPKRKQAHGFKDVRTTDQQLSQMSDKVYDHITDIKNKDLNDIFGVDRFGKPNAQIIGRKDLGTGFQAIAVKNKKTGEVIIAYRGSDTENYGADWWGQNYSLWSQDNGLQDVSAKEFVEEVKKNPKTKNSSIVLTGHSLGGYLAQKAAKETGLPAVTYNAPGLKPTSNYSVRGILKGVFNKRLNLWEDVKNSTGGNDDQVINYVNKKDAVGSFGLHYGKTVVTGDGEPSERNDYLHPLISSDAGAVIRGGLSFVSGGSDQVTNEHSLDSFDNQYRKDGNIDR